MRRCLQASSYVAALGMCVLVFHLLHKVGLRVASVDCKQDLDQREQVLGIQISIVVAIKKLERGSSIRNVMVK